jgi:chromosomal replication initiator protein
VRPRPGAAELLRLRTLVDRVASDTGVQRAVLVGPGRSAAVVRARFAIVWLARTALDASLSDIGRQLGGRDHTTILHAERRAAALRTSDPAFRDLTDRLHAAISEAVA